MGSVEVLAPLPWPLPLYLRYGKFLEGSLMRRGDEA